MDFQHKRIVITGASQGLGAALARRLSAEGARLLLVARTEAPLAAICAQLAAAGGRAHILAADLTVLARCRDVVSAAEAELGGIDVLINNAGIHGVGAFADTDPNALASVIQADLIAPVVLTRAVLPGMLRARAGQIVNVASLAGKFATPYQVAYSAAKTGLVGFSRALRTELEGTGVSVSVVCPGVIRDQGMFATLASERPVAIPARLPANTLQDVVAGILTVLGDRRAELLINPGPMRLFLGLSQVFPQLDGPLAKLSGGTAGFGRLAGALPARGRASAQGVNPRDRPHRRRARAVPPL